MRSLTGILKGSIISGAKDKQVSTAIERVIGEWRRGASHPVLGGLGLSQSHRVCDNPIKGIMKWTTITMLISIAAQLCLFTYVEPLLTILKAL